MDSQPSGKIFSFQINSLPFGEYDECLSIESPDTEETENPKIYGHYCSLGIPTNMFPPADQDHFEDNKRIDEMIERKMLENLNNTDSRKAELKLFREQLEEENESYFFHGMIRYLEYLGPEKVRLPTGLCLPSTCNPKDVEYAINKSEYDYFIKFNLITITRPAIIA